MNRTRPRAHRTDQELRQLASDMIAGRLYGSWQLPPEIQAEYLPEIFVQLKLAGGEKLPRDAAAVFEYFNRRSPASEQVNGHPIFWSHQTMTAAECRRFNVFVHQGELDLASMLAGVVVPGVCVECGCVEGQPCAGGCAWIDSTRTMCSACARGGPR